MTKKDVIISISGKQFYSATGESEPVELITSGELARTENEFFLTYRESDLTGFGGTVTTILVEGARVTMLRSGPVTTQMVFEQGKRHISCYETEEGALTVGVQTKRVSAVLGDSGGDIEMEYDVDVDHAMSGGSYVHINVREASGKGYMHKNAPEIICDRYVN